MPPAAETPGLDRDLGLTPPGACRAQEVSPLLLPLCHLNKVLPRVTEPPQHHPTEGANPLGHRPVMGTEMATVRVTTVRVTTVRVSSGLPIPLHRDAAGSAQSHVSFPSGANTSRCSASCDVSLSPLLPLLCHRSSLTHLHWGQDMLSPVTGSTQHRIRSCLPCPPLLSPPLAVCPRG